MMLPLHTSPDAHNRLWISIPFTKFSHNTCPHGASKYQWTHLGERDDFFFVIQDTRLQNDTGGYEYRTMMKLTASTDVLEHQDLGVLAKYVLEFDPSSGAQHPVQTIVKCPIIAMRYPKTASTVRRIQLKFKSEEDFTKALNVLRYFQMPIIESNIPAPARPSLSSTASNPALTAHGSTTAQFGPSRPVSTPQLPVQLELRRRHLQAPSIDQFKIPARPNSVSSASHSSTSGFSSISQVTRPYSASSLSSISSYSHFTPHTPWLGPNTEPNDGISTPNLSQTGNEAMIEHERSRQLLPDFGNIPSLNNLQYSGGKHSHSRQHSVSDLRASSIGPVSSLNPSPFLSPRYDSILMRRSNTGYPWQMPIHTGDLRLEHDIDGTAQHTDSISSAFSDPQALVIPPKRVLPFPEPRGPDKTKPSIPDPSPLPATVLIEKATPDIQTTKCTGKGNNSTTELSKSKNTTRRKQKEQDKVTVTHQQTVPLISQKEVASPLATKSALTSGTSSKSAGLQSKAVRPQKRGSASAPIRPPSTSKRPKMADHATQTQTLSGRNHSTAVKSTQIGQAIEDTTTPNHHARSPPPKIFLDDLHTLVAMCAPQNAPKEIWKTPRYLEMDEEERQALINDFICENLENEDFLKLCEDTEKTWRRIGLGK